MRRNTWEGGEGLGFSTWKADQGFFLGPFFPIIHGNGAHVCTIVVVVLVLKSSMKSSL